MNCVANARIIEELGLNIYVPPGAGDDGASLGAALFVYNCLLGKGRVYQMDDAYLGPSYSTEYIQNFLETKKIKYKAYQKGEVARVTAKLVREGMIVGWFQGKMEWGARALGSRSILADATNPKMKEILNDRVKHREDFRPFAPVSTVEDAKKYFDIRQLDPFMVLVCDVRPEFREKLPSITHFDGSARLQTIRREKNPQYYDAVKEFEKLSGIAVLINTSFNIRGEPIVCTPEDAFRCMMGTGIDVLVMDRYVIYKKDNAAYAWTSVVGEG